MRIPFLLTILYSIEYIMQDFYPNSCPQKLGIISESGPLRNQEKIQKRMFFDQSYWLKVTVLLKKKPTCFQVG
ncbi:hypothetical protein FSC05_15200 (plasmid) [Acinetobacter indicus]|nr:hypothetical protein FSC05_15200 [Acinetobacter indicus]QIC77605.1 hypothetical protein FSC17_15320 [Acinetobacter indicus]QIC77619.1 hypothetical protein FSC17_15425 [Acinetobacter indicus]